jgi:hypothetical protein
VIPQASSLFLYYNFHFHWVGKLYQKDTARCEERAEAEPKDTSFCICSKKKEKKKSHEYRLISFLCFENKMRFSRFVMKQFQEINLTLPPSPSPNRISQVKDSFFVAPIDLE